MAPPSDQGPVRIDGFTVHDERYCAVPPLHFPIAFDRRDGLYDLEGDFGISLWAESRSILENSLKEELAMLWTEYAREEPSLLSPKAQRLRDDLLKRFRKVES